MTVFTVEFDYTGRAPTQSRMDTIMEGTGFANYKKTSLLVYKITTSQSKATVQQNVDSSVEDNGSWDGGSITSADVS